MTSVASTAAMPRMMGAAIQPRFCDDDGAGAGPLCATATTPTLPVLPLAAVHAAPTLLWNRALAEVFRARVTPAAAAAEAYEAGTVPERAAMRAATVSRLDTPVMPTRPVELALSALGSFGMLISVESTREVRVVRCLPAAAAAPPCSSSSVRSRRRDPENVFAVSDALMLAKSPPALHCTLTRSTLDSGMPAAAARAMRRASPVGPSPCSTVVLQPGRETTASTAFTRPTARELDDEGEGVTLEELVDVTEVVAVSDGVMLRVGELLGVAVLLGVRLGVPVRLAVCVAVAVAVFDGEEPNEREAEMEAVEEGEAVCVLVGLDVLEGVGVRVRDCSSSSRRGSSTARAS